MTTAVAMPLPFMVDLLRRTAEPLGIRVVIEPQYRHAAQLIYPDGRSRNFRGRKLDLNPTMAAILAQVRSISYGLLAEAGIATPRGDYFLPHDHAAADGTTHDRTAAPAFAASLGYPVYVKTASYLKRSFVRLARDPAELEAAMSALFRTEPAVYVQEGVAGRQIGMVIVDGEVGLAYDVAPPEATFGGPEHAPPPAELRVRASDSVPAAASAAAARALAYLGLRYAAVEFFVPEERPEPVLLDVRSEPDLEQLAALGTEGLAAVAALVARIVVALGRSA